jgi:hypothetical protein
MSQAMQHPTRPAFIPRRLWRHRWTIGPAAAAFALGTLASLLPNKNEQPSTAPAARNSFSGLWRYDDPQCDSYIRFRGVDSSGRRLIRIEYENGGEPRDLVGTIQPDGSLLCAPVQDSFGFRFVAVIENGTLHFLQADGAILAFTPMEDYSPQNHGAGGYEGQWVTKPDRIGTPWTIKVERLPRRMHEPQQYRCFVTGIYVTDQPTELTATRLPSGKLRWQEKNEPGVWFSGPSVEVYCEDGNMMLSISGLARTLTSKS